MMNVKKTPASDFYNALELLSGAVEEKSELNGSLRDCMTAFSIEALDRYPMAMLRILRALWYEIEIYINSQASVNEELMIAAVAQLESLENNLKKDYTERNNNNA